MTRLAGRNLVPLDIGGIKIIASTASGGANDRRIARYRAIGVNGAELEDLGQDERQDGFTATVTEAEFVSLDAIKEAGKPVTIVHPLFGSYQGRLAACRWTASSRSGVEVQLTIVEDGAATTKQLWAPASVFGASVGASTAWGDANSTLLDLASVPDLTADIWGGISDLTDAWTAFDDALSLIEQGAAGLAEAAAALTDLDSAVNGLMDVVDGAWGIIDGIAEVALEDTMYPLLRAARGVVESLSSAAIGTVVHTTQMATSLADVARKYLGSDDDAALDAILAQNPSQIDYGWVPAGVSLMIAVE